MTRPHLAFAAVFTTVFISAFAATLLATTPTAAARIYAVVVGVDDYRYLPPLNGAANDARDLAAALDGLDADVVTLINDDATRDTVMAAFRRQARAAGPGDMFFFSYSGHGIQEPEAIPGDEADGMDETIVFGDFDRNGARSGERMRDNEIGALLAEVNPQARATVLFDSCTSGTMTRALDPRGLKSATRFGGIGRISGDPLPKPKASQKGKDMATGANVVFIAAARDGELIPEVEIDGRMRGAVSWTVARALEGSDDLGGPGMPISEFRSYVRAQARALSAARQTPDVIYDRALLADAPVVPSAKRSLNQRGDWRLARAPAVWAGGARPGPLGDLGAWAASEAAADLIWDRATGDLVDRRSADPVAEIRDLASLRPALEKWRAVRSVNVWAPSRPLEFRISPGDGRHRLGALVSLAVERPAGAPAHVTIVNLASDGAVQYVYPDPASVAAGADIAAPGPAMLQIGATSVTYPVGADHVFAILSPERPDDLRRFLDSAPSPTLFAERLTAYAATRPGVRVGITPIYTTP